MCSLALQERKICDVRGFLASYNLCTARRSGPDSSEL